MDATAKERETRPARHPWWFEYDDARLADTWFRECLYFPYDNPTKEEREFYRVIVKEFLNQKRAFRFYLEPTEKAFWQWYHDEGMKEIDQEHFPLHNHEFDKDFFHNQLENQDYYYKPTIYGPKGWSQNYLWDIAFDGKPEHQENRKELEPYFKDQERRQRKRPDHFLL